MSPGGIGYDINCGVRLIRTNLTTEEVRPGSRTSSNAYTARSRPGSVPTGAYGLRPPELDEVLANGAAWAVDKGYGRPEDLPVQEEEGRMAGALTGRGSRNRPASGG